MSNLRSNKELVADFLRRFHLVIFIVIVVLSLSVAIFLLNIIVNKASGTDPSLMGGGSETFDQATIQRVERLKSSNEQGAPLDLVNGRISPFNE